MRYQGSKRKIARELLSAIPRPSGSVWVEPFCGGLGMAQFVEGPKILNDANSDLIELWKSLQDGRFNPPEVVTEEEYLAVKNNPERYAPEVRAFIGFGCSFGGKLWGGYARSANNRQYAREARNLALKSIGGCGSSVFSSLDYRELTIPPTAIVYCDPPYLETAGYGRGFDTAEFWEWARAVSLEVPVYISEFSAPSDFHCIKAVLRNETMGHGGGKLTFDRLYKYVGD